MARLLLLSLTLVVLAGCMPKNPRALLSPTGKTVKTRVLPPEGYHWKKEDSTSFAEFLQNIPVEPDGTPILDFHGTPVGNQGKHVAVLTYDVGTKDLQQCADAVLRLRAEYLYAQQRFDEIAFHFTSGDLFSWNDYKRGMRAVVDKNKVTFVQSAEPDDSYPNFRRYLDALYMYAGTISLFHETEPILHDSLLKAGDIIITPGSPGHAVIIIGHAIHDNGDHVFLLAEGLTPAQSIAVITNPLESDINPWYRLSVKSTVTTTANNVFLKTAIHAFR